MRRIRSLGNVLLLVAMALPAAASEDSLGAWQLPWTDSADALRYAPLEHREDTWYRSTYWTGPNWTRVGKDWQHPGENTPSVRRFTCPKDGRLTISGRAAKYHVERTSDGVRLAIRHNANEIWRAEIDGGDEQGVEPALSLEVHKGDAIRFVVHKRGQIFCDTTRWDPTIRYADGTVFQASNGFSKTQGESGWTYEMETGGDSPLGAPMVYTLGQDASLRVETLSPGRPLVLVPENALPLIVLPNQTDSAGAVVAIAAATKWRLTVELSGEGKLEIHAASTAGGSLKPSERVPLPAVFQGNYRGPWLEGFLLWERAAASIAPQWQWQDKAGAIRSKQQPLPDLGLWLLVQADWRQQDKLTETAGGYAAAAKRHLERTQVLLADLRAGGGDFLKDEAAQCERLAAQCREPAASSDLPSARSLYLRVRWLKRQIALSNPRMQFGKLLFAKRVPTSYSHLVMQYFGWRARPGGGLFVLDRPGWSLACRDLTGGTLADGNVLEPRLSYDGQRVVFSFVRIGNARYEPDRLRNDSDEGFYHLYEMPVAGGAPRQLTQGPYDDLMPSYLPDGGIVFSSTRRRGYARCFGGQFSPRWHVYTLHRRDADGTIRTLSYHDTNEWFPAVSNSGQVLYSRWDYIDRDAVTHQNLWAARPDGSNPIAVWGNATPSPHCTFQPQPIAGSSKIVFTASAHHSITAGSLAIVDPTVARDGQTAITRLTPEIPFPEAEGTNIGEYYSSPWPLSEKYFLVAYSPWPLVWEPGANRSNALGLYLLDIFGNRELLYRDLSIGCETPIPVAPRAAPPVLPNHPSEEDEAGEMTLIDVYQGLPGVPRGTIKELRLVQIFPKTTPVAGSPPVGLAGEENGRAILGTVPVEPDGSARFLMPARRPILFQALDGDGFAQQTMRSVTYVQPGERVACIGCHEDRAAPPRSAAPPLALRRPASALQPGPLGGRPFSYLEVVQPILQRHCVGCHDGKKSPPDLTAAPAAPFVKSYLSLCGDRDFWAAGTSPKNAAEALVPRFGARNQIQVTPPGGRYGALGSRLIALLRRGHYDVRLEPDDYRRLAAWIDLNAIFYGVNPPDEQARQLRGEAIAMPEIQ